MYELVIKHIHEKDKTLYFGILLLTFDVYIISKIITRQEERIRKIEKELKENNVDKSKGE